MGDDRRVAVRQRGTQSDANTCGHVGKAFAIRGTMVGQLVRRKDAKIGQIGVEPALPRAEVLFPQCRIGQTLPVRPKRQGSLPASARRAGDQPVGCSGQRSRHRKAFCIRHVGLNVGPPAQTTPGQRGRMPDQRQLCRSPAAHRRIPPSARCPFLLCHRAMSKTILITGGARSGKSVIAETKALSLAPRAVYIATAEVRDAEMAARVADHRARRGPEWIDHAEAFDLTGALRKTDGMGPRLVDCLTLWLTNLMLNDRDWRVEAQALCAELPRQTDPVVIVTNEVGAGIVPDNKLARDFRDAAGLLNQWVAAVADEVILAVAGLPMKVK